MKKGLKIVLIVIGLIIILGLIFFAVDYNRAQKQEKPIFCIPNPAGECNDGGTMEYFGLGYKVIDFNMLNGYDETKIGTWFMKYEDFADEYNYTNNANNITNDEVIIKGYNGTDDIIITGSDSSNIKFIIEKLDYTDELCDGIYSYSITLDDGETYTVKHDCKAIEKGNKQAAISSEDLESIENIIEKYISDEKTGKEIPEKYDLAQAIKDGCLVIANNAIYNKNKLDAFVENINSNDRKSDFIRIVKYTIEGDAIITDLEYKNGIGYILTTDNTRDAFGADTKIVTNSDIPEEIYELIIEENENYVNILLKVKENENSNEYKSIIVSSYSKETTLYDVAPSFIGEVTKLNDKSIIVNAENLGSAISVSVENASEYKIGDKVEVFYTGYIEETDPAQISEIAVKKYQE